MVKTKRPTDSSYKLWELFNHAFSATSKVRKQELDQFGITLSQSALLRVALRLRKKDLYKKNLVRIEVTDKGYDLYRTSRKRKYIDSVMSVLTEEEKTVLWACW